MAAVISQLFVCLLVIVTLSQIVDCAEYGYYSSVELGEQPSWFAPPSGNKYSQHNFENTRRRKNRKTTTRRPDSEMPWKSGDKVNLAGIPGLMRPKNRLLTTTTLTPVTTECACNVDATPEYNPVCASNTQTFSNPGRLQCARKCGQPQLTLVHYGACRT